jgi:uncharacterized UPF0160 family protein
VIVSKILQLKDADLAVHDGRFNADDVHVSALLETMGIVGNTIRTRDPEILAQCHIRADVGGKYDPDTCDFDHHQEGGAGRRANGVPYSALGLVWKEVGAAKCGSQEIADMVDRMYIQSVDIRDCGSERIPKAGRINKVWTTGDFFNKHNPSYHLDTKDYMARFEEAKDVAGLILEDVIDDATGHILAPKMVRDALALRDDKRILVLDRYVPWGDTLDREAREVRAVVFCPDGESDTGWRVSRQGARLPREWCGKKGESLVQVTGVSDATFCSETGHVVAASTKEGALALARLLIQQGN